MIMREAEEGQNYDEHVDWCRAVLFIEDDDQIEFGTTTDYEKDQHRGVAWALHDQPHFQSDQLFRPEWLSYVKSYPMWIA
jgi:hypothetical protein